jgi:hypothetical protein
MTDEKSNNIRWKDIIRNAVIVLGLTLIGGIIIGITIAASGRTLRSPDGTLPLIAIGSANVILSTLGFFICGCLTRRERWKYLSYTVIAVWLCSLINLPFLGISAASILNWIMALPLTFLLMLIGGGLSTLFVKSVE